MSSSKSGPRPSFSSVQELDLQQWKTLVDSLGDPTVAHAVLEVFDSEQGSELRAKYTGIYLKLRLTKHQERVSYAQATRRKETVQRLGRLVGSTARLLWKLLASRCNPSQSTAEA